MTLKARTAVVTGSTSGIGHAIACALAKAGANVVVNGLGSEADNSEAIRKVAAHGTRVAFDGADMLRHNQIAEMIAKAERDLGSVDIVVNNAGIQHVSPIEEFPIEKWDAIIAINLSSSFHTIRAALPAMKKRNWGRIINVCSAHSLVASPFKSAYVAAKHGLAGLTKVVALEVAETAITVNAISPGFVWTPLVERQIPDLARSQGISEEAARKQVLASQRGWGAGRVPGQRRRPLHHRRQLLHRRRLGGAIEASGLLRDGLTASSHNTSTSMQPLRGRSVSGLSLVVRSAAEAPVRLLPAPRAADAACQRPARQSPSAPSSPRRPSCARSSARA